MDAPRQPWDRLPDESPDAYTRFLLNRQQPFADLTGRVFGRLTVTGYAGRKYWNCRCTCGQTLKSRACHLTGRRGKRNCTGCPDELHDRFLANVRQEPNGCWLWAGNTTRAGYGTLGFRGEQIYAHRYACGKYNGTLAPGAHVLHRCDTPGCVNPEHLFAGTHADNMADMAAKGRHTTPKRLAGLRAAGLRRRGERHPLSKLSDAQRATITRRLSSETAAALAREFRVSPETIRRAALITNRDAA